MELKAKTAELEDNEDTKSADISFEELLAKEKKDSFWLVSHLEFPGDFPTPLLIHYNNIFLCRQKKGRPNFCTGK